MFEEQKLEKELLILLYFTIVSGLGVIYMIYHKRLSFKLRLQQARNSVNSSIPEEKIIIAFQIKNFFIELSNKKRCGFSLLQFPHIRQNFIVDRICKLLGVGIYYRLRGQKKMIQKYLQLLLENKKIVLFVYTKLNKNLSDHLLNLLEINQYFDTKNRRYCVSSKHPTKIDVQTKRVIIVTEDKRDHQQEDAKYFLVFKNKQVKKSLKILKKLTDENQSIDELHNEMSEYKVHLESDYEEPKC